MNNIQHQKYDLLIRKKELLTRQLTDLKTDYKSIKKEIDITIDSIQRVSLERRLQYVANSIEELEHQLKDFDRIFQELSRRIKNPRQTFQKENHLVSKLEVLRDLNLGRIVAEQDDLLESCFIPTVALREIISEKADLVLGTKGSGKSAIWVELSKNRATYWPEKEHIIVPATNPTGDPEFRDVLAAIDQDNYPSEDDLRLAWRLYLLGQVWKAVKSCNVEKTQDYSKIKKELSKYGLIYENSSIKNMFAFAVTKALALKKLEVKWKDGIQFEFDQSISKSNFSYISIPFNDLLSQMSSLLRESGKSVWIVLDRLDEIVINNIFLENLTLKGLLLAYRDLSDLGNIKIKIFLRDDIYNRVTTIGQFPALTHIRSRATRPIKWSIEDLLNLVVTRLVQNKKIRSFINLDGQSIVSQRRREIFYTIFPPLIDRGNAAEGFKWIVDRITDGKDVATPRDLLSVIEKARVIQLEKMERDSVAPSESFLFDEDSIRLAVKEVAKDNLETRIFAEYPDLRTPVLLLKGNKADHNSDTFKEILGDDYSKELITRLESVGLIYRRERKGHQVWTIPFFYSFALDIKRGAAFDIDAP